MRWLRLLPAILCYSIGGCLVGCTATLKDNGKFTVGAGWELTFEHTTSTTDATSELKVEAPALVSWLVPEEADQSIDDTE